MWLVGYNCYAFDNTCLAFHSSEVMGRAVFKKIILNTNGRSRTAFVLNMPYVYNVDMYLYLDKSRRSTYENLALDTVARHHGLGGKEDSPKFDGSDIPNLIKYNVRDCIITLEVWVATRIEAEVYSLCAPSGCSPVDACRMITGTMAACAISTHSIFNGCLVDWSECEAIHTFKGGAVMRSMRGLHYGVAVADYSSMYPNIMISCRISPDNVTVVHDDTSTSGALYWSETSATVHLEGLTATFDLEGAAYTSDVLDFLIKERAAVRKQQPMYGMVLKVLANSIYGATGYVNSHMYSPACAASVTAVGRWLSLVAECVFIACGLEVVAGDTDSCFVKATRITAARYDYDLNQHTASALKVLHTILSYTPLKSLRMECKPDETFYSLLLIKKKMYCGRTPSGLVAKGISTRRMDRLAVVRHLVEAVVDAIHMDEPLYVRMSLIAHAIAYTLGRVVDGDLSISEVSKQVRKGGATVYRYKDDTGEVVYVKCDNVSPSSRVRYDAYTVLEALRTAVNALTIPAGMGTITTLYERNLTL
jgi:DNA polymerase elongation subunit (family B)